MRMMTRLITIYRMLHGGVKDSDCEDGRVSMNWRLAWKSLYVRFSLAGKEGSSSMSGDKKRAPIPSGKVICVDFDGTLFEWGELMEKTAPFVGAVEALRAFKKAGYEIIILTSRMSPTWWKDAGMKPMQAMKTQMTWIMSRLDAFGIPYDRITAEKVPARWYIDDRAIGFQGRTFDWNEIRNKVLKDG